MTGLCLEVQKKDAEKVASDELAGTWARFPIFVGDDCLTLIRHSVARGYRDTIDVSVYPLAEWGRFQLVVAHEAKRGPAALSWWA